MGRKRDVLAERMSFIPSGVRPQRERRQQVRNGETTLSSFLLPSFLLFGFASSTRIRVASQLRVDHLQRETQLTFSSSIDLTNRDGEGEGGMRWGLQRDETCRQEKNKEREERKGGEERGRKRKRIQGAKKDDTKSSAEPNDRQEGQQGDNESEKANWVREIQIQIQ